LISSLIKNWWRQFADAIEGDRLILVSSPASVEEFAAVVRRPAFAKLFSPEDVEGLSGLLRSAELFEPSNVPRICRDPSDDYLLALASGADADALVTRDEDLLVLRRHGRTEIISVVVESGQRQQHVDTLMPERPFPGKEY
jgi:putative PIN family toxin of toxin-antitoxin system